MKPSTSTASRRMAQSLLDGMNEPHWNPHLFPLFVAKFDEGSHCVEPFLSHNSVHMGLHVFTTAADLCRYRIQKIFGRRLRAPFICSELVTETPDPSDPMERTFNSSATLVELPRPRDKAAVLNDGLKHLGRHNEIADGQQCRTRPLAA